MRGLAEKCHFDHWWFLKDKLDNLDDALAVKCSSRFTRYQKLLMDSCAKSGWPVQISLWVVLFCCEKYYAGLRIMCHCWLWQIRAFSKIQSFISLFVLISVSRLHVARQKENPETFPRKGVCLEKFTTIQICRPKFWRRVSYARSL